MGYRTLVIGTDGSPTATYARDAAIKLAKRFRAHLVLVAAYDPSRSPAGLAGTVVENAVEAARREGVEAVGEVQQGEPADVILQVAEQLSADLVIVGNKGMGQATRFRLGGVPDRVAHFAPCDLLIVDTSRFAEEGRRPGVYKKLVAGTDGSPTASEAARKAFDLAAMLRAEAVLVYVGDPIIGAIRLEETARVAPEGVQVHTRVTQGDPAEQICAVAEGESADLIVVGNKGMSGARRFLLGSVPNKVAHYAPTDVLIVKTVDRTVEDIAPGHGAVVQYQGKRMAVYRDESGRIVALSPRCTHMGCTVDWNDADRTWDCPCHGSRYTFTGQVIQGPAVGDLDGAEQAERVVPLAAAASSGSGTPAPARARGQQTATRARAPEEEPFEAVSPWKQQTFVIVGGGLTGGNAAVALRDNGFDGRLVMVCAEGHVPYERPPLSKSFLRGETAFEEALVRPLSYYRDHDIQMYFSNRAVALDGASRTLVLERGDPIRFDRLLIATGARNRRFPIPGIERRGVYDLRTVADAERIRSEVAPGRRVVMAGMGFIGSEVAASLRQSGLEVTAVEGSSVPLERVLGPEVGGVLAAIHRDHGVELVMRETVAAFEGDGRVDRVVTSGGRELPCDFVVTGFGVQPNVEWLEGSGVEVDNGVLVDPLCRTNVEGVFAAGDVANHDHPLFGRRMRIEHWQNAIRHGRAAAMSMLDRGAPYEEVHWFWSDQYEHNIQYAGFHTEWDEIAVRGSMEDFDFVAFYLKDGRVQAVVGLNRGTEVRRTMGLIRAGGPVEAGSLRDESIDLAALAST